MQLNFSNFVMTNISKFFNSIKKLFHNRSWRPVFWVKQDRPFDTWKFPSSFKSKRKLCFEIFFYLLSVKKIFLDLIFHFTPFNECNLMEKLKFKIFWTASRCINVLHLKKWWVFFRNIAIKLQFKSSSICMHLDYMGLVIFWKINTFCQKKP